MKPEETGGSASHDDYCGRLLNETVSPGLMGRLTESITALRAFEVTEIPVMPYISAWKLDEKIIWYEFVSRRLTSLLQCTPGEAAKAFRESVINQRLYKFAETTTTVKENILDRKELETRARKLRNMGRKTGLTDAILTVRLPGGRTVWLKDRATVETFEEDRVCLSFGCLTDVSKEMMQKDQLSEDKVVMSRDTDLLVKAERHEALGQLSAQVYHEIRNPISAIGGLARRIYNKGEDANIRMYLEVIAKEALRLEQVVNNLFQFTQPMAPKKQLVEPPALLKNAIVLLQTEIEQNGIRLSVEAPEQMSEVLLDPVMIEEALVHIIKNAIESIPERGRIELKVQVDENHLYFIIKDYGMGIRSNHQSRVTEPFFTTKVNGSGFGLSLAKKYIQLHLGSLQIISNASTGTRVVIKLPSAGEIS